MKKIRCARCSVVNLEGFVSYPNCAACGARLPEVVEEKVAIWRRPLGTSVWASILGVAILLVLLGAASWLRNDVETESRLVVMTQHQVSAQAGEPFTLALHIDAVDIAARQSDAPLRNVRLRIPLKTNLRFQLVNLQPVPDLVYDAGRARYFSYNRRERASEIKITMRALRLGRQRLQARLYSEDQISEPIDIVVRVRPAPATQTKKR